MDTDRPGLRYVVAFLCGLLSWSFASGIILAYVGGNFNALLFATFFYPLAILSAVAFSSYAAPTRNKAYTAAVLCVISFCISLGLNFGRRENIQYNKQPSEKVRLLEAQWSTEFANTIALAILFIIISVTWYYELAIEDAPDVPPITQTPLSARHKHVHRGQKSI